MTQNAPSLLVHDYCGHPFTAEFSRQLARNGWRVMHVFFAQDGGPKGRNVLLDGDPGGLSFHALDIAAPYSKSNYVSRRRGDLEYGRVLSRFIETERPDIVLSGNTPTEAQTEIVKACAAQGAPFIYWCQDFYSIAASKILAMRLPVIGHAIGAYYRFLERRQMQQAAAVIHITDAFRAQTQKWGIAPDKVSVIPNWGVIDEIPVLDKTTPWRRRNALTKAHTVVYSGTLALKHNPDLLKAVATAEPDDVDVVVVGFGVGADALKASSASIPNLHVLPLQPFAEFPQVLASADVLVAVIEEDAGQYSVPSKVLSYLCAGRPIVLAAPRDNLAAEIVIASGAGVVVAPDDIAGFVAATRQFLHNKDAAEAAGRAGRAYAEAHFDLAQIARRFEAVFEEVLADQKRSVRAQDEAQSHP